MSRDRRWLLLPALPAFVALLPVVSHYGGIDPLSFAFVLPILVLALVMVVTRKVDWYQLAGARPVVRQA